MDRWLYYYVFLIIVFGGITLAFAPAQKTEQLDDDFADYQEFSGFKR